MEVLAKVASSSHGRSPSNSYSRLATADPAIGCTAEFLADVLAVVLAEFLAAVLLSFWLMH